MFLRTKFLKIFYCVCLGWACIPFCDLFLSFSFKKKKSIRINIVSLCSYENFIDRRCKFLVIFLFSDFLTCTSKCLLCVYNDIIQMIIDIILMRSTVILFITWYLTTKLRRKNESQLNNELLIYKYMPTIYYNPNKFHEKNAMIRINIRQLCILDFHFILKDKILT